MKKKIMSASIPRAGTFKTSIKILTGTNALAYSVTDNGKKFYNIDML